MSFATGRGIAEERILLDPGIGFGKTVEHNLELLRRLDELVELGRPRRDRDLAQVVPRQDHRTRGRTIGLPATIATNVLAYERGARVFRVHDVAPVRDALIVTAATVSAPWKTPTSTTT